MTSELSCGQFSDAEDESTTTTGMYKTSLLDFAVL